MSAKSNRVDVRRTGLLQKHTRLLELRLLRALISQHAVAGAQKREVGKKKANQPPIGRTQTPCGSERLAGAGAIKPAAEPSCGDGAPRRTDQLPTVTITSRDSSLPCASRRKQRSLLRTAARRLKIPSAPVTFCSAGLSTRAAIGGARSRR